MVKAAINVEDLNGGVVHVILEANKEVKVVEASISIEGDNIKEAYEGDVQHWQ